MMSSVERFESAARAVAATVERVHNDGSSVAQAIRRAFPDANKIAIANPVRLPEHLFEECRKLRGVVGGKSKNELAGIDLGITEAFAGVARTGSICVDVDAQLTGYASLLGRVHVALLAAQDIVERPSDLFRTGLAGSAMDRSFVFITGPSATADMGPLVRGVHGPHQLHVLILEE